MYFFVKKPTIGNVKLRFCYLIYYLFKVVASTGGSYATYAIIRSKTKTITGHDTSIAASDKAVADDESGYKKLSGKSGS